MKRRVVLWLMAAVFVMGLNAPTVLQAQGERLQVVGSFSILADVIANVAGDAADVTSLMPLNADPHGFSPTPRDVVTLAEADVVFTVGANFEEGLAEIIANAAAEMNIVVASSCVPILPFGMMDQAHDETDADQHADAEDHELAELCASHHDAVAALPGQSEAGQAGVDEGTLGLLYTLDCGGATHPAGEHAQGACDPHVWTDPANVMLWTLMIRDTLSDLDPANAAIYAANAETYLAALETLIAQVAPMINSIPVENRQLVTNHLAYSYYAHRFGLELVGVVTPGASTLAQPSASQITALIDAIRAADVPAVFADSTANPGLAQQVAEETGTPFYRLYTGSLTAADGPAPTYLDYILVDTQIIVEALGGSLAD